MRKSRFPLLVTVLVLLFLYAPIVVLIVFSFNDSRYPGAWNGFTLKWYAELFSQGSREAKEIWRATGNTLIVATSATVISVVVGTISAWVLYRYASRLQRLHKVLVYAPLVVPDILIGISLLMLFVNANVNLGLGTIIVAHTTFCISYVALVVLGRLQDFDPTLIDAAKDLGAGPFDVLWRILIPLLGPGIAAGGLLAFTLSVDDFVITFFTAGPGSTTLPIQVYSMMRHGSPTLINALSVILVAVTFTVVITAQKLLQKSNT